MRYEPVRFFNTDCCVLRKIECTYIPFVRNIITTSCCIGLPRSVPVSHFNQDFYSLMFWLGYYSNEHIAHAVTYDHVRTRVRACTCICVFSSSGSSDISCISIGGSNGLESERGNYREEGDRSIKITKTRSRRTCFRAIGGGAGPSFKYRNENNAVYSDDDLSNTSVNVSPSAGTACVRNTTKLYYSCTQYAVGNCVLRVSRMRVLLLYILESPGCILLFGARRRRTPRDGKLCIFIVRTVLSEEKKILSFLPPSSIKRFFDLFFVFSLLISLLCYSHRGRNEYRAHKTSPEPDNAIRAISYRLISKAGCRVVSVTFTPMWPVFDRSRSR